MGSQPPEKKQHQVNFVLHLVDRGFLYVGQNIYVFSRDMFVGLFRALDASPTLMGFTFGVPRFSYMVTLLTAQWVESKPQKKTFVLVAGLGLRLPALVTALVLWRFLPENGSLALVVAIGGLWLYHLTHSILGPAMIDLWGDTIVKRSRFFSYKVIVSGSVGTLTALGVGWFFDRSPFPDNYILLFWIASASSIVSWLVFTQVLDNPPKEAPARCSYSFFGYLTSAARLIREDRPFALFLAGRITNEMSTAFLFLVTLDYLERFQMTDAALGRILFLRFAPAIVIAFLAGRFSERFGPRTSLVLGASALVLMYLMVFVVSSPGLYLIVFLLMTLHLTIWSACEPDAFLEIAPADSRVTYNMVKMLIPNSMGAVTAPIAGLAAEKLGYHPAFALAALLAVISLSCYVRLSGLKLPQRAAAGGQAGA